MDVWQSTREYLGWKAFFNLLHANWIWSSTFTYGVSQFQISII